MKLNRYQLSFTLFTDMYELTMAQGYWKNNIADKEAVFHLYFRKNPFDGGYAVCAGLQDVTELLKSFQFSNDDLDYLQKLKGTNNQPLFETGFLTYLKQLTFTCQVDAIPEGTVVFPNEPLIRVTGPLLQCQLIESALLNIINFQTLISSKAARITDAANGDRVIEFGMRRAQGPDGALSAARAAYIGGVEATSNLLAGNLYNIPVAGTHAHSWVMAFNGEQEAFTAYANTFPHDSVFLVDTFDTLVGVQNAIIIARKMRENGAELNGIRLDSGDLAYLSREARAMLNEAGFPKVAIIASNDLDEYLIESLKMQGAQIDTWGIGTKLVTAYDQPALGGVYKLAALKNENGIWDYKLKLSEQLIKITTPGVLQVRRYFSGKKAVLDMIYSEDRTMAASPTVIDPADATHQTLIPENTSFTDLLVPVFRDGQVVYKSPGLKEIKAYAREQVNNLNESYRRFLNPHVYKVGLEENLYKTKMDMILKMRKGN